MMRYLYIFLFLPMICTAQNEFSQPVSKSITVRMDALTDDSLKLFTLPSGVLLESVYIAIDSTLSGVEGDSIKIGIQGDWTLPNFRFGDFPIDSLAEGSKAALSNFAHRQTVAGKLYTYQTEVSVTCAVPDSFHTISALTAFPYNDFMVTMGGGLQVPKYRGGWYNAQLSISFSSSVNAVAFEAELYRNGVAFPYAAFERTIGTANTIGSASFNSGIYLDDGDSVSVRVKADKDVIFEIQEAQFSLIRFRDETPYVTDSEKQMWLYSGATGGQIRVFIKYTELF